MKAFVFPLSDQQIEARDFRPPDLGEIIQYLVQTDTLFSLSGET